ncbi:putative heat shock 70 kDa protein 16-like [Cocos nucifera]|uniref:Putative heat shock 70 kDa protein 16-like n=1 Tax=Cocos nucifera TaxID=13894 RepID=A0A8K0HXS3_COCNU|nr:putative heat shock 70 kDa protein 16-like [Cocos nucifera]
MSMVGFDIGNDDYVIAAVKQHGIDVLLNDKSKQEILTAVSFGKKRHQRRLCHHEPSLHSLPDLSLPFDPIRRPMDDDILLRGRAFFHHWSSIVHP